MRRKERDLATQRRRPWVIAGSTLAALLFIGMVFGLATLGACKERTPEEAELEQRETDRRHADDLAREIVYGYEERSDRCFAYIYEMRSSSTTAHGGPGFDTFECTERIKPLVRNPPAGWSAPHADTGMKPEFVPAEDEGRP